MTPGELDARNGTSRRLTSAALLARTSTPAASLGAAVGFLAARLASARSVVAPTPSLCRCTINSTAPLAARQRRRSAPAEIEPSAVRTRKDGATHLVQRVRNGLVQPFPNNRDRVPCRGERDCSDVLSTLASAKSGQEWSFLQRGSHVRDGERQCRSLISRPAIPFGRRVAEQV
jgi:hypothetical protein